MITDHDLRVRAIRRRHRVDDILYKFILHNPGCRWTKLGRAKDAQWSRVWQRVRDDYMVVVGNLNCFQLIAGTAYESAADLHVAGCRCQRCPGTPKRRDRQPAPISPPGEGA